MFKLSALFLIHFRKVSFLFLLITIHLAATVTLQASYLLLPMDAKQSNHLKAYGITYWVIAQNVDAFWLLNYRGGSFALPNVKLIEKECLTRGVNFEVITDAEFERIKAEIGNPEVNQDVIKLEKAPKIAVYTPELNEKGERIQPWDDAVTMALVFAEIPFEKIYDKEIMGGMMVKYDWLHLHHEDFTGQYGKFYNGYRGAEWYQENQQRQERVANELGFKKVSQLKLAVAKKIKEYVVGGGFLFTMCSATDSYDIALAAEGVDICENMFDGDGMDNDPDSKLDFT
ncbi:MAG: asparagine synthetase B, partial [Saprospiraceae bacterium]